MRNNIPRIVITAPGSNQGKTTVTLALLKAFLDSDINVRSFKTGPDYIDPMFHKKVLGIPSSNLDMFIMGKDICRNIFAANANKSQLSIIEGVMGYYDGIGNTYESSSYDLARNLGAPVILVVNVKGMAVSSSAIVKGFLDFTDDSNIQGVIINGINTGMYNYYKDIIESHTGVKVYGHLPLLPDCTLGSRHLGLITADEIKEIESILNKLGNAAKDTIDLEGIMELARSAPELEYDPIEIEEIGHVRIAIARDSAFTFYYEDSLDILKKLGAELVEFSPIKDNRLPENISGLYIGGGYPELYIEELSENKEMIEDTRERVTKGLPTFAECGGYMYLQEGFLDERDNFHPLVGVISGKNKMTKSLKNFGYATITAQKDNLLCRKGESINIHEFHYSTSDIEGDTFIARKPYSNRERKTICTTNNLFAGYPHIHFASNIEFAKNFVTKSLSYGKESINE